MLYLNDISNSWDPLFYLWLWLAWEVMGNTQQLFLNSKNFLLDQDWMAL